MALRPRTVKAGSLAAIAVPSVLGSTLVAPAPHSHPSFRTSPAQLPRPPKSLFTSHRAAHPLAGCCARSASRQNRQSRLSRLPQRPRFSPSRRPYTAQAAQPAQATQQAAPSATFQSAQAAQAAQPSAQPTLAQVAQTPAATQNVAPTRSACTGYPGASGVAATRTNQTFLSYTSPAGTTSQYHVYAEGVDFSKPVGVVFYFDGDYWQRDESKVYTPDEGMLAAMGKIANARNMVFVPVILPGHQRIR